MVNIRTTRTAVILSLVVAIAFQPISVWALATPCGGERDPIGTASCCSCCPADPAPKRACGCCSSAPAKPDSDDSSGHGASEPATHHKPTRSSGRLASRGLESDVLCSDCRCHFSAPPMSRCAREANAVGDLSGKFSAPTFVPPSGPPLDMTAGLAADPLITDRSGLSQRVFCVWRL